MKEIKKYGSIIFPYCGINFNICTIIETINGDDFYYTFIPNYNIINLIPSYAGFEGIQGLNLDIKKEKYERNRRFTRSIRILWIDLL